MDFEVNVPTPLVWLQQLYQRASVYAPEKFCKKSITKKVRDMVAQYKTKRYRRATDLLDQICYQFVSLELTNRELATLAFFMTEQAKFCSDGQHGIVLYKKSSHNNRIHHAP